MRSVLYKGTGPMLLDVASSQIHVAIGFLAEVDEQYIVPGKVIPVGTLGPRRLPRFPNLPTMGEMGFAGFDMLSWTGLFVPGGTPKAAITRLNAEITKVVREPEFAAWLAETGSEGHAHAGRVRDLHPRRTGALAQDVAGFRHQVREP